MTVSHTLNLAIAFRGEPLLVLTPLGLEGFARTRVGQRADPGLVQHVLLGELRLVEGADFGDLRLFRVGEGSLGFTGFGVLLAKAFHRELDRGFQSIVFGHDSEDEIMPRKSAPRAGHHSVYVVYLRNPRGDGRAGYYVGMTGLTPEQRFANHKAGIKAAGVVRRFGERLVPRLYEHLNPMSYDRAKRMEGLLAESLRKRGYLVFGGH